MPKTSLESEHLFDEIKRYVSFDCNDEACLTALGPRVEPHAEPIIDDFYDHILKHSDARHAIAGGEAQVQRLKGSLLVWLRGLFAAPWDIDYYERRARIGRRHVAINLPQQYMFTAVDVIRNHLVDVVLETAPERTQARAEIHALNKLLDLELAIMLHTYREDTLAKLRQGERMATFGQLVASIAHELRNPLGVIESSLFLLRKRATGGEPVTRHLDKIEAQVRLSNRIITNLLDMVRDRPPTRRIVPLGELVTVTVDGLILPAGLQIIQQLDGAANPGTVFIDPDQVRQILTNLLLNAVDAAGAAGEVRITARSDSTGQQGFVVLQVADSGTGIAPAILPRLFEPLVTTKTRGIGLGLALCRRLAERNGGRIALGTSSLSGAAFDLWLPVADTAATPGSASEATS